MKHHQPAKNLRQGITREQLLSKYAERLVGFNDPILVRALNDFVLPKLEELCIKIEREKDDIFPLAEPKNLFSICSSVDAAMDTPKPLPEALGRAIALIRRDLSQQILSEMFLEDPTEYGDEESFRNRYYQEKLAKLVGKIVTLANQRKKDAITPEWIKTHNPSLFQELMTVFYQHDEKDWSPLIKMLPDSIAERCEFDQLTLTNEKQKHREAMDVFERIFEQWPSCAAELFLITHEGVAKNVFAAQKILRTYLGNTHQKGFGGDPSVLPPAILHKGNESILRIAQLLFRQKVYQELQEWHDQPLDDLNQTAFSGEEMFEHSQSVISKFCNPSQVSTEKESNEVVQRFLKDVTEQFQEILQIPVPQRLKGIIISKDGKETRHGLSLRQKIAMYDVLHLRDHDEKLRGKLIAFFMGKGKTLTSFLIYESLRDAGTFATPGRNFEKKPSKMLYICPTGALPQQVANQVKQHYKDGQVPTVGIIDSDVQSADISFILNNEIVIIPYSMLSAKRKDHVSRKRKSMVEFLNEKGFDLVVQDEPQNANKPGHLYTRSVSDIMKGCGAHCFVQLSGNPFPNSPEDAIAQLALAREDLYKNPDDKFDPLNPKKTDVESLYQLIQRQKGNPRLVRAALHEFILCLDEQEDWEKYLFEQKVELKGVERRMYDAALHQNEAPSEKIWDLIMTIMNPGLQNQEVKEHSYADATGDVLFDYLEGRPKKEHEKKDLSARDAVVMVESLRRYGILVPEEGQEHLPREMRSASFFELVQDRVIQKMREKYGDNYGNDIDFQFLHGDTPEDERKFLLLRSQHPELLPTLKIFQLSTQLAKKNKEYALKITDMILRSTSSEKDINEITESLGLIEKDLHKKVELCEFMEQVYSLTVQLIPLLENLQRYSDDIDVNPARVAKVQEELSIFCKSHPEIVEVISDIQHQQETCEGYVVTEPDIFEQCYDVLLPQNTQLSQWLDEVDPQQELQDACEKFVVAEQSLKSLRNGHNNMRRHYHRELTNFVEKTCPKDGREKLETFLPELDRLAGIADGNVENFLKELQLNPSLNDWLTQMEKNYPEKKVRFVLYTMRQIIGEGIDLSKVERAIFTGPYFIKPAVAQAVKRFDRHGKEVHLTRMQVSNSIFEGIWKHSEMKMKLVMLLLYGGWFTPQELQFIKNGDFGEEMMTGAFYLSPILNAILTPRQRLSHYIAFLEGRGAEELQKFLLTHGEDYAKAFLEQWETSYSINNARFVSAMIDRLKEDESLMKEGKALPMKDILDCGCGPLVLENTFGLSYTKRNLKITSVDMNEHLLKAGHTILSKRRGANDPHKPHKVINSSMVKVNLPDESFDLVNSSLSFNYLDRRSKSKDPSHHERVEFMRDKNRLLKNGGILLMSFPCAVCPREEFEAFCETLSTFGFRVLEDYTGMGKSLDHQKGEDDFKNWVVACQKVGPVQSSISPEILQKLKFHRSSSNGASEGGLKKPVTNPEAQEMHHNDFTVEGQVCLSYKRKTPDITIDLEVEKTRLKLKEARVALRSTIEENGADEKKWNLKKLKEIGMTYKFNKKNLKDVKGVDLICKRIKLYFLEDGVRLGEKEFSLFEEEDTNEDEEGNE